MSSLDEGLIERNGSERARGKSDTIFTSLSRAYLDFLSL
jgi:hypothetical protein